MFNYTSSPIITLFLLPLFGTIVLVGIINLVSRPPSEAKLVSAATGIVTAWLFTYVLGISNLPTALDGNSIPYMLLAGLLGGTLIDYFLSNFIGRNRFVELLLDLAFAAIVIFWIHSKIDFWWLSVFVAWGTILLRVRKSCDDPRLPATMMVLSAIGLAVIAWIGNNLIDRDLALGVASAGLGISTWLWFKRHFQLGFGFFWGSYTALMLITLRILETNIFMAAPIFILCFIFFSDSVVSRSKLRSTLIQLLPTPVIVGGLSILPIILAAVAALIATNLMEIQ